jgi:hypothetical protein
MTTISGHRGQSLKLSPTVGVGLDLIVAAWGGKNNINPRIKSGAGMILGRFMPDLA